MKKSILVTVLVLTCASVSSAQCKPSPAVRNAIEAANKAFVASLNSGSAASVAAMYTSDARLHPPNSPTMSGREGIQAFWQSVISAGIKAVGLQTTQVEACGDTAYEVGKYELTIPSSAGGTVADVGKYIVIWKKDGRRWKLAHDIWNTNAPAGK